MAELGFYNANENRAYPFQEASRVAEDGTLKDLSNAVIVDLGIMLFGDFEFDAETETPYLKSVSRSGSVITFVISSANESIDDIEFVRTIGTSPDFAIEYVSVPGVLSAYLVTGSLDSLSSGLLSGESLTGETLFEQAIVRDHRYSRVSSVNLANEDRTRVVGDSSCPIEWDFDLEDLYVIAEDLTGYVRFAGGANCEVLQDSGSNSVQFRGEVGVGAGIPCGEVKVFPEETAPQNRTLLDGSLSCHEVITSINGISLRNIPIVAGPGVSVTTDPEKHTVTVTIGTES